MTDLTPFKELAQQWETQAENETGKLSKAYQLAAFQLEEAIEEYEEGEDNG